MQLRRYRHDTKTPYPCSIADICCKPRHVGLRCKRLSPRYQLKNPVMFVVWLGSLLTTRPVHPGAGRPGRERRPGFILAISLWLWFTVLFANFAEAMAEGRSKAQAAALQGPEARPCWPRSCMEPQLRRQVDHGAGGRPAPRRRGAGRSRRHHPRRRRSDRRRRLGGRIAPSPANRPR